MHEIPFNPYNPGPVFMDITQIFPKFARFKTFAL